MKSRLTLAGSLLAALLFPLSICAHQPPTPEQIAELKAQGLYEKRVAFAESLGNDKFSQDLFQSAKNKILRAQLKAQGLSEKEIQKSAPQKSIPSSRVGLPTTGEPKSLTLLIDFSDTRGNLPVSVIQDNIYGDGTTYAKTQIPYDSVASYYNRASEGKLSLRGNVLGYYNFPNPQFSYVPRGADLSNRVQNQTIFDFVKVALRSFENSHDFAQYDNDGDGDIDSLTILYSGERDGWSSFWWAYQWSFWISEAANTTFDGKTLNTFVFQSIDRRNNGTDFQPRTLIHETGHLLGFPDLYDYKSGSGQEGGVGGFDMMDSNKGNPMGFLRWIADWIEPDIISAGASATRTLRASGDRSGGDENKATVIFPGINQTPFQEFYMIENRHRIGNDGGLSNLPSDGLAIWHVDATLNSSGSDFVFTNTDRPAATSHKLVQLVQADGLSEIEQNGGGRVDAGDYYIAGRTLTPTTTPNSNAYNGADTDIFVDSISANGLVMTADIGFGSAPATQPNLASDGPLNAEPLALSQGENLSLILGIRNFGNAPAGAFIVRHYLSRNLTGFSPDILLGETAVSGLAAGAQTFPSENFPIPATVSAGNYTVGWVIDADGTVAETLESDNNVWASANRTITISNGATTAPNIAVSGSGSTITTGDDTPRESTGTNFGNIDVGTTVTRTFTIRNTGSGTLTLNSTTAAAITGGDNGQFSFPSPISSPIAPGNSTTFSVNFTPTTPGTKLATLTVNSDDPDTPAYSFAIGGSGTALTDDHGNTTASATSVTPSSSTPGEIETAGDRDVFSITLTTAGTLTLSTTGNSDTYGTLIGTNGTTTIQENDDSGPSSNFQIEAVITTPGTYFLQVRGFTRTGTNGGPDTNSIGPYTLLSAFQANIIADDHSNTPTGATIATPGTIIAGVLEQPGDLDVFQFTVPENGTLSLQSTSTIDTIGTLTDTSSTQITTDDDGGINQNFALSATLAPGTYFLTVAGFNATTTTGSYTIESTFTPVSTTPDDHGNTLATATTLLPRGATPGNLETGGDIDYFTVTFQSAGIFTAYTTGTTDTFGTLEQATPITDDDNGPRTNFELLLNIPSAGTHVIFVQGFDATTTGQYTLTTHFTAATTLDDHWNGPGDSLQGDPEQRLLNTTHILQNSTTPGTLETTGDTDFFSVDVTEPGTLTLSTTGTTDTFGILRDAHGTALSANDDATSGNTNFSITHTIGETEEDTTRLFIQVEGFQFTATGAYNLSLTFTPGITTDDHPNDTTGATTIADGTPALGIINQAEDLDYFQFTLTQSRLVTLGTTGTTDTIGLLTDASGTELGLNDDASTTNRNFSLTRELPPGTYFVRVRGFNTTTGTYNLSLTTAPLPSLDPVEIQNITISPTNTVTITIPSVVGVTYRLMHSQNLNTWLPVVQNIPGTGAALQLQHTGTPGRSFYQVIGEN